MTNEQLKTVNELIQSINDHIDAINKLQCELIKTTKNNIDIHFDQDGTYRKVKKDNDAEDFWKCEILNANITLYM